MMGTRFTILFLLAAPLAACSQDGWTPERLRADSTFSFFFTAGSSFSRAEDAHINKWLTRYDYKPVPRTPVSLHVEVAAMPMFSRTLYSFGVSGVVTGQALFSMTLTGGIFHTFWQRPNFLLMAGVGAGIRTDRVNLDGNMPDDYKALAQQYDKTLSLKRNGFVAEPALRAYWFPCRVRSLQIGLSGGLGYALDYNSSWKLGYYKEGGRYSRFRKLQKAPGQHNGPQRGWTASLGLTARLRLH